LSFLSFTVYISSTLWRRHWKTDAIWKIFFCH